MRTLQHFLSGAEDCQWLRDTALSGTENLPAFGSFTFDGNEDCPLAIALYRDENPNYYDSPVAAFRLETQEHSNLGMYVPAVVTLGGEVITATNLWDAYSHPGKFEGEPLATILAYEVSMDGAGDTVGGEHGEISYEAVDCGGEVGIPNLYAILTHHSNGFVTATWYDTAALRDEAFTAIEEEYAGQEEPE